MRGFPVKNCYVGEKGIYLQFPTEADAEACYQKGLSLGARYEKHDSLTVIWKSSSADKAPS
jgi:hypothetical protein